MASLTRKCPACGGTVARGKYLCASDWRALPTETRQRLYSRDGSEMARYMVLIDQIENRVPLDCIVVPA